MPAVAVAITTVAGGTAASDGSALQLVTTAQEGTEVVLSFPYGELLALIAAAIQARTECKILRGLDPNQDADLVATKRYELGCDTRSGLPVLMMTLANGGKISFALSRAMAAGMHETLGVMLGGSSRDDKRAPGLH